MPTPVIDMSKCSLCGACAEVCPLEVFEKTGAGIKVVNDKCIGCHACEIQCETNAIKLHD